MCALVTGVQTCALPIYFHVLQYVHAVIGNAAMLEDSDRPAGEAALREQRRPLHEQDHVAVADDAGKAGIGIGHLEPRFRSADRKGVVSGKSVSVRVDLGGRRIIKTKKKNTIK